MYRPYTTIGTNRQTHKQEIYKNLKIFFTVFWGIAAILSRALYLLYGRKDVFMDLYGLFARSMVRLEEGSSELEPGLAYAYTRNISRLLKFTGNRIEAVAVYQMILQILWLFLLFAGLSLLFGYAAGAVAGSILAASPWIMGSVLIVWPGNYYMLHFSLALVLLGCFGRRAEKEGWFANDLGRLCLAAAGFYVGVLCIWNILGILLAFAMVYVLTRNYIYTKRKRSCEEGNTVSEPKRRMLGVGGQAVVLAEGILIGIFATLMKYTGVTGEAIVGQARWWLVQLKDPFTQYAQFQIPMACWVLGASAAGILCWLLFMVLQKNKETKAEVEQAEENCPEKTGYGKEAGKEMAVQGEKGRYITTEDGRTIKLLDNPLPGPKKHVRKEMDFDREFEMEERVDDFDISIADDDDFDI